MNPETPIPAREVLSRWQAIVGTLVGAILAQGGSLAIVGLGLAGLMIYRGRFDSSIHQDSSATAVITLSGLTASLFLLAVSLISPLIAKVRIGSALGFHRAPFWTYPAAVLGALGLGPIGGLIHTGMKELAPTFTFGTVEYLNEFASENTLWLVWPLLALMPAFCEEVFFRGMLQRALGKAPWAIIVSGVAFALFHLDPHHVAAVLPIGLYMAWLAARTGSTFVPITAHLANNSVAVLALRLQDGSQDEPIPWWLFPSALLVCAVSIAMVILATRRSPLAPSSPPPG